MTGCSRVVEMIVKARSSCTTPSIACSCLVHARTSLASMALSEPLRNSSPVANGTNVAASSAAVKTSKGPASCCGLGQSGLLQLRAQWPVRWIAKFGVDNDATASMMIVVPSAKGSVIEQPGVVGERRPEGANHRSPRLPIAERSALARLGWFFDHQIFRAASPDACASPLCRRSGWPSF
jgi:hypothetical protein